MHRAAEGAARVVVVSDRLLPFDGVARLREAGFDVVGGPDHAPLPGTAEQQRMGLRALSAREQVVMAMMAEGCTNAAICRRLGVCDKTVEGHVRGIFAKLGLRRSVEGHRRVMAVLIYIRHTETRGASRSFSLTGGQHEPTSR